LNYEEQQKYFDRGRILSSGWAILILLTAAAFTRIFRFAPTSLIISFWIVTAMTVVTLLYAPGYLHLSVNPDKPARWAIMVRWRIVAAAAVLSIVSAAEAKRFEHLIAATSLVVWLLLANMFAKSALPSRRAAVSHFASDLTLIVLSLRLLGLSYMVAVALLAASTAFYCLSSDRERPATTVVWAVIVLALLTGLRWTNWASILAVVYFLSVMAAVVSCVHRAQEQNHKNISAAMGELTYFTGYSAEKIREMWATSNQR
jgi:hypothetical protein